MTKFPQIFREGMYCGKITTKNRLVFGPLVNSFATKDGMMTERQAKHYRKIAAGGVGLITVEMTIIHPFGKVTALQNFLFDDRQIPAMKRSVDAIHAEGVPCIMQLGHGGRQTPGALVPQPLAPSAINQFGPGDPLASFFPTPRALTVEEIKEIEDYYIDAIIRCKKAGFDGVQLHCAHGYVLHEFLSPAVNKRDDQYGPGTNVQNRIRIITEIIKGAREKVGDYPIDCRIDGNEFYGDKTGPMPGIIGATTEVQRKEGITPKIAAESAVALAKAGADGMHVSGGCYGAVFYQLPPMDTPRACHLEGGIEVKKALMEAGFEKVTVTNVGRINNPELAEKILEETPIDFICLGRPLWVDPDFPAKALTGRSDLIRTCIACNQGCTERVCYELIDGECIYNVQFGKDLMPEFDIRPAAVPRKVLVVGGGPGGLEAAEIARKKGHEVTLCEKSDRLGGQVNLQANAPFRGEWREMIRYYENMLKHLGVKVQLNTEVTPNYVERMRPDAVIIATGSTPVKLPVPGADLPIVVQALDVLAGVAKVGDTVAVIAGLPGTGKIAGYTADLIASQGKKVVYITPGGIIQNEASPNTAGPLLRHRLFNVRKPPVEPWYFTEVKEIRKDGVVVIKEGKEHFIKCDTVVMAVGGKPNRGLYYALRDKVPILYAIGDAVAPTSAYIAVHEGFHAANAIK